MTRKEAVVILVVLGLLGYTLVPALNKVRRSHLSSACTNNLQQLGRASALYGIDNMGIRPGPQPLGMDFPGISWDRSLAIYVGLKLGPAGIRESLANLTNTQCVARSFDIFSCTHEPLVDGARLVPEVPGALADGMAAGNGICRSYTMNLGSGNLVAGVDDGIAPAANAIPLTKIEVGSGTVHLIENQGYATVFGQRCIANDTYITCDKSTGIVSPRDAFANRLVPMHGTKAKPQASAVMHDGHAEVFDQAGISANHGKIMQYVK
jgi:hypothetical protein